MKAEQNWKTYFESHGNFILASTFPRDNLHEIAATVRFHPDNGLTVMDLVEARTKHNWNTMIYEAWIYETGNQVRQLLGEIESPIFKQAVKVYAEHHGYFDGDRESAYQAIREASYGSDGDYSEGNSSLDDEEF